MSPSPYPNLRRRWPAMLACAFHAQVVADVSRHQLVCGKNAPIHGRVAQRIAARQSNHAKRLECGDLPPVLGGRCVWESGSKFRALQTLRDFGSSRSSPQPALSWATRPHVGGYALSANRARYSTSGLAACALVIFACLAFVITGLALDLRNAV